MASEFPATRHSDGPAVSFREVGKRFGGLEVLADVSLDIAAGSVHAFMGANGAGKSTALGLLSGRIGVTAGEIEIFGRPLLGASPRVARRLGVSTVFQELTIIPQLSALENVFLGRLHSRCGWVRTKSMKEAFAAYRQRFSLHIDPDAVAGDLSVSEQQMLEILRCINNDARIMLLDEPTASLPQEERKLLFDTIRHLQSHGTTIVIVSHNLQEVLDIADTISVFRNGRVIATHPRSDWTKDSLVQTMLGKETRPTTGEQGSKARSANSNVVLDVQNLSVAHSVENISFAIRAGEIIGIGGLMGSGRTTLLRALAGLEQHASGSVVIDGGRRATPPGSPREAIRRGISLIPEDRKRQGLILSMNAAENILISDYASVAKAGFLSAKVMQDRARQMAGRFEFDFRKLSAPARNLSGGNQQKLLLARWSHRSPKVLLADEPTRGIDIGAKEEMMKTFRALAREGLAIVFVSSELEEVCAIADRILVMAAGRMAGWLPAGATPNSILKKAFEGYH